MFLLGIKAAVNGESTDPDLYLESYTVYVNPYYVVTPFSDWVDVSKHYFMGSQRVASEPRGYATTPTLPPDPEPQKTNTTANYPTTGPLAASSAWSNLEFVLDALQINADPNFWNALLNPQLNYAEQMSLEQYRESMGECEEYTNETEEYEACLCAISPYWARIDNYIQCHEYRIIYWYHPDYLGHNELITDRSGNPYQYFHYTAWGESFAQAEATQGSFSSGYRFNAKELDAETGNYYYGARYYHPKWSVWLGVDAMASQYPSLSPYVFTENNPIRFIDPDGNSTWVTDNGDDTYSVVAGGDAQDGDLNVYVAVKNEDGTYSVTDQSIGESVSAYSFTNDDGTKFIEGAVIDLNDHSGEEFVSKLHNDDPSVGSYMFNGFGGRHYDFKKRGLKDSGIEDNNIEKRKYLYRGMSLGGKIASARDIGNIGAGYIAGRAGLSWSKARFGFNLLESIQQGKFSEEGLPTVNAQFYGWIMGTRYFNLQQQLGDGK
jgi:RHS repeat-associated protein